MDTGWVKLHRKILSNDLLMGDNTAAALFFRLLLKVDRTTGSYSCGREAIIELAQQKRTTAYYALKRLEAAGIVHLRTTKTHTIIHIINWKKYQSLTDKETMQKSKHDSLGDSFVDSLGDSQITEKKRPVVDSLGDSFVDSLGDTKQEVYTSTNNIELLPKGNKGMNPDGSFGTPIINEMIQTFEAELGLKLKSVTKQRKAAHRILTRIKDEKRVRGLVKAALAIQNDQFAPRIYDIVTLDAKLGELNLYYKKKGKSVDTGQSAVAVLNKVERPKIPEITDEERAKARAKVAEIRQRFLQKK